MAAVTGLGVGAAAAEAGGTGFGAGGTGFAAGTGSGGAGGGVAATVLACGVAEGAAEIADGGGVEGPSPDTSMINRLGSLSAKAVTRDIVLPSRTSRTVVSEYCATRIF